MKIAVWGGVWEPIVGPLSPERRPSLTQAIAATERSAHLQARIFKRVPHDLFKFASADENVLDSPIQGGEGDVSVPV